MIAEVWTIVRRVVLAFIEDNAISRGAAIAFYAVTGFVPAVVFTIAGLSTIFGSDIIRRVIARASYALMGREADALMQLASGNTLEHSLGLRAEVIAGLVLAVTASGAFGEIQSALNAIWKVTKTRQTWAHFLRERLTSLLLVLGLGALLLLSVLATTAFVTLNPQLRFAPGPASAFLRFANFAISLVIAALLFAAIYKVLPDIDLEWSDVGVGGAATAALYELGQFLIGIYFANQSGFSTRGAAGSMIVLLLWIYYSAQVFLLGAEITKEYALRHGPARRYRHVKPDLAT